MFALTGGEGSHRGDLVVRDPWPPSSPAGAGRVWTKVESPDAIVTVPGQTPVDVFDESVVHSAGLAWRTVLWRSLWQPLLRGALVLSVPLVLSSTITSPG